MPLFSGASPDLLYAAAWVFLFGFFVASRHLSLRISFFITSIKVAIPLVYFSINSSGILHLSDDVHYFYGVIGILQMGFGPLSILTDPRGLPVLYGTAGTAQHILYHLWSFWGALAFGPHYFSSVFLNVGATFVSGWFFYRILRHMAFSARYCRIALAFFLLHWDIITWSSFLNLKDTLVATISLALLYNYMRFFERPRFSQLAAICGLSLLGSFLRFYMPMLVLLAGMTHFVFLNKNWIKSAGAIVLVLAAGVFFVPGRVWGMLGSPVEFVYGLPQFLSTPMPWNLSAGYEFLLVPAVLHLLLLLPAMLAIPSLWRRHSSARFLLIYLLVVILAFAMIPANRGIRQRQMVTFVFIWMQFHALRAFARYAFRSSGELPALDGDPARLPEPRQEQA